LRRAGLAVEVEFLEARATSTSYRFPRSALSLSFTLALTLPLRPVPPQLARLDSTPPNFPTFLRLSLPLDRKVSMTAEPFTTRQLIAALFGWLATGFGTWLMIPAWLTVVKMKPAPSTLPFLSRSLVCLMLMFPRSITDSGDYNRRLLPRLAWR
jgi:hypothetical protein